MTIATNNDSVYSLLAYLLLTHWLTGSLLMNELSFVTFCDVDYELIVIQIVNVQNLYFLMDYQLNVCTVSAHFRY